MADVRRVKLEGVAELKRALAELGPEVATKVGATADRQAANILRDALIETAPRSADGPSHPQYGHLSANIRTRKVRVRTAYTIRYTVSVGKAFWGSFLEFGTAKIAAQPWMRPVFDRRGDELLKAQTDGLRVGIEKAAKKAARGGETKRRMRWRR